MVEILNVSQMNRLKIKPNGVLGVCGFVSAIEGPHKWSDSTDWRLSIKLSWFSRQSEDDLFIAEHIYLWIWTSGDSDSFPLQCFPVVRPGDFLVALPCSIKPTGDSMVLQLPARQAPKRVILVTPSDRAGSWESFRPLCSVRNEKKPELYKRIMSGLQESMLDLKNTPTALISSLRDEDEIFGHVMSIVLVGRQQDSMENIEMVLTIFVDDEAESWPDIPRDVFSGQKLTLLGDDLTQLFPNQFLNYRQLLLKSSSALSAIGQMIQPGKFVSLTGTRMMLPFEFIRSADASDCQKICCSDLTQPNSSLMVLDETCPVGINLLQKLRTSDKPTSS